MFQLVWGYQFYGITKDNKKVIIFTYSDIESGPLKKYYKNNIDKKTDFSDENIKKTFNIFDNTKDEDFIPSLLLLDNFIQSMRYESQEN